MTLMVLPMVLSMVLSMVLPMVLPMVLRMIFLNNTTDGITDLHCDHLYQVRTNSSHPKKLFKMLARSAWHSVLFQCWQCFIHSYYYTFLFSSPDRGTNKLSAPAADLASTAIRRELFRTVSWTAYRQTHRKAALPRYTDWLVDWQCVNSGTF